MSRAHVTALALVNWKGVFYERYLLDRHVTALEGANGAGKTTVMIAAYVVLLPDMSRLRFTNLGESGATGGDRGVWGRLGEPGRPSYAALDLALAGGERLIAGVRLTRGAEPSVELTPFVVTGLGAEVRLQDLLLVRGDDADLVPELDELRAAVARAGGGLEVFRSTREYLAALFDRGVTPLRLASDEDRNKLNEMLRTSMTGGISRALTTELRSFLLREESGLADTLGRMRANLEACRRTRAEVAEARQLEREISGVYEAGLAMFTAAVHAAREAADEGDARGAAAAAELAAAERAAHELAELVDALATRQASLDDRIAAARLEVERATTARDRRNAAASLAARAGELERELIARTGEAASARAAQGAAAEERAACRRAREHAADAYDRAAHGLAHLQDGLDELHRRAHAHRHLRRRLDDARGLLARPELELADAAAASAIVAARRAGLEAERARLERDARDLELRRREHGAARAALEVLEAAAAVAGAPPPGDEALHVRARAALARLADREALVARSAELQRELAEAERLVVRQRVARARAEALGLAGGDAGVAGELHARLDAAERDVRDADDRARAEAAAEAVARDRITELTARRRALENRAAGARLAAELAGRLTAALETPVTTRAELLAVRDRITDEQRAIAARRTAIGEEREALRRRAAALEAAGGEVDPELLRLRDELGGELLQERFEDLEPDQAATVEARLGPLTGALIVEDVDAAVAALVERPRTLPTVWLVGAGAELEVAALAEGATDAVCVERFGARVTRRAIAPTLGRRARERRAAELRAAADALGGELDTLADRVHRLSAWRRDADLLAGDLDSLEAGEPSEALDGLEAELAELAEAEQAHREVARDAREQAAAARATLADLQRLLGDALLLDGPDLAARRDELGRAQAIAATAGDELATTADARARIAELVDVLRAPPPDADALAAAEARRAAIDEQLDRLFAAATALDDVLAQRHAAAWDDAAAALAAQAAIVPQLQAQHAAARDAVTASDAAVVAADAGWEAATAIAQDAEARRAAVAAHHERAAQELAALGSLDELGGDDVGRMLGDAVRRLAALEAEARAVLEEAVLARERREQAARRVVEARATAIAEADRVGPAAEAWRRLRDAAHEAGLLDAALTSAAGRAQIGRGSVQLAADATSKRDLLVDRLARARGGEPLARELRELPGPDATVQLSTWLAVRDWLRRRVPAQVADVPDPLDALERLRDHLGVLEGRLARQDADLRGASEDVARGIDVQLRRARGQVRALNQHLEGVQFGSIAGIRVQMRRIDRMEQILRALREGESQELLFLPDMPIEEALDEIFRRHGGGRGGGQRLLDYREYLELAVEIQRRGGDAWEVTSPTRLSTGEAIGVGAALMMVVLTAWERDANLLRGRRSGGSLRFLFLDEANRLSGDNLGVLFELCRNLDLQLLIAAPEVARAEGNTTYRLIRHVGDDGREEVIVSGRRIVAAPPSERVTIR